MLSRRRDGCPGAGAGESQKVTSSDGLNGCGNLHLLLKVSVNSLPITTAIGMNSWLLRTYFLNEKYLLARIFK